MADAYSGNGFNPKDIAFVIVAVAISLLLLFQNTAFGGGQTGSYSTIYYPILAFAIILISVAIATRGRLFNEVIYGRIVNEQQLYKQIAVVGIVSLGLAWYIYTTNQPTQAFIPLAVDGLGTASLATVAVIVFIGPLIEELFARSALTPTIASALGNTNVLSALGFIGAIVFLYMFQVAIVGYAFLALAFVAIGAKITHRSFFNGETVRHITAIAISVTVWTLFHVFSYGQLPNVYSLMFTAALFGIVIELTNWFYQNTISGFVIHPAVNGAVLLAISPALFGAVALIVILSVLMIIVLYSGRRVLSHG